MHLSKALCFKAHDNLKSDAQMRSQTQNELNIFYPKGGFKPKAKKS